MDEKEEDCTNCNIELEVGSHDYIYNSVIIRTWVEYCPKCLKIYYSDIDIRKINLKINSDELWKNRK